MAYEIREKGRFYSRKGRLSPVKNNFQSKFEIIFLKKTFS